MDKQTYDIAVVGSGMVGAVCAVALAKMTPLKIAVLDVAAPAFSWQEKAYAARVSAMTLSSQRILQSIGAWEAILAKRTSPFTDMRIWDDRGSLHFNCQALGERQLGFIIENNAIRESVLEQFPRYDHLHAHWPMQLLSLQQTPHSIELMTEQGPLTTQLLIGADGANSWVRQQLGIPLQTKDYGQRAIIAQVSTTAAHQMTAWQRFLPTGPLAFLPLKNAQECSIVWSAVPALADELLSLDDKTFCKKLSEAFAYRLGEITAVSPRQSFPLQMRHAAHYVREKVALIGDAAHTVHPLAGQGAHLGLLDAACLVDVVRAAVDKKRQFASFTTLRRYERWRKGDTLALLTIVDFLKQLFASTQRPFPLLRNVGLNLTDRLPLLKTSLARYAVGNREDLPTLAWPIYTHYTSRCGP